MMNELNLTKAITRLSQLEGKLHGIGKVSSTRGIEAGRIGRQARDVNIEVRDLCLQKLAAIDGCVHQLSDFSVEKPGDTSNNPLFQDLEVFHAIGRRINDTWHQIVSPVAEAKKKAA